MENNNKSEGSQKKALLFGSTGGHGAVMTIISEQNLIDDEYDVTTVCEYIEPPEREIEVKKSGKTYWGTGNAGLFWGSTFPKYPFPALAKGSLIVIANIPIGIDERFPSYTSKKAIGCIKDFTSRGINVQIIDHHKATPIAYAKAREAGAEIVISSSSTTTHYGKPNEFSLFWGRIGAICDRDRGERFPEPKAKEETLSLCLDRAVRANLDRALDLLRAKNIGQFFTSFNHPVDVPQIEGSPGRVVFLPQLSDTIGFKQLDAACEKYETHYAMGLSGTYPNQALLVATYWKSEVIPGALYLGLSSWKGHPEAFTYSCGDPEELERKYKEWITLFNCDDPKEANSIGAPVFSIGGSYYKNVETFMGKIDFPQHLTLHGWPHVQNVLTNIRTLGSLFNVKPEEQLLLDWAALLHDVGRGAGDYYGNLIKELEKDETLGPVDKNHSKYSKKMIETWDGKGVFKGTPIEGKVKEIADLCCRHSRKISLPDPENSNSNRNKLCMLLKIADAIDMDKRRAQRNDFGTPYDKIPRDLLEREKSIPYWLGHLAIQSVRIYDKTGSNIRFELIVTNQKDANHQIKEFKEEISQLTNFYKFELIEPVTQIPSEFTECVFKEFYANS